MSFREDTIYCRPNRLFNDKSVLLALICFASFVKKVDQQNAGDHTNFTQWSSSSEHTATTMHVADITHTTNGTIHQALSSEYPTSASHSASANTMSDLSIPIVNSSTRSPTTDEVTHSVNEVMTSWTLIPNESVSRPRSTQSPVSDGSDATTDQRLSEDFSSARTGVTTEINQRLTTGHLATEDFSALPAISSTSSPSVARFHSSRGSENITTENALSTSISTLKTFDTTTSGRLRDSTTLLISDGRTSNSVANSLATLLKNMTSPEVVLFSTSMVRTSTVAMNMTSESETHKESTPLKVATINVPASSYPPVYNRSSTIAEPAPTLPMSSDTLSTMTSSTETKSSDRVEKNSDTPKTIFNTYITTPTIDLSTNIIPHSTYLWDSNSPSSSSAVNGSSSLTSMSVVTASSATATPIMDETKRSVPSSATNGRTNTTITPFNSTLSVISSSFSPVSSPSSLLETTTIDLGTKKTSQLLTKAEEDTKGTSSSMTATMIFGIINTTSPLLSTNKNTLTNTLPSTEQTIPVGTIKTSVETTAKNGNTDTPPFPTAATTVDKMVTSPSVQTTLTDGITDTPLTTSTMTVGTIKTSVETTVKNENTDTPPFPTAATTVDKMVTSPSVQTTLKDVITNTSPLTTSAVNVGTMKTSVERTANNGITGTPPFRTATTTIDRIMTPTSVQTTLKDVITDTSLTTSTMNVGTMKTSVETTAENGITGTPPFRTATTTVDTMVTSTSVKTTSKDVITDTSLTTSTMTVGTMKTSVETTAKNEITGTPPFTTAILTVTHSKVPNATDITPPTSSSFSLTAIFASTTLSDQSTSSTDTTSRTSLVSSTVSKISSPTSDLPVLNGSQPVTITTVSTTSHDLSSAITTPTIGTSVTNGWSSSKSSFKTTSMSHVTRSTLSSAVSKSSMLTSTITDSMSSKRTTERSRSSIIPSTTASLRSISTVNTTSYSTYTSPITSVVKGITTIKTTSQVNKLTDDGHTVLTSDTTTVRTTHTMPITSGELHRPPDDSLTLGLSLGLGLSIVPLIIITGAVCFWQLRKKRGKLERRRKHYTGHVQPNIQIDIEIPSLPCRGYGSLSLRAATSSLHGVDRLQLAQIADAVNVKIFLDHVIRHENNPLLYTAKFESLPKCDIKSMSGSKELANTLNNRYKDILPYDETRVILKSAPERYINASHIQGFDHKRRYIATQGPLPTTQEDFWLMLWDYNCRRIAMLTNLVEKMQVKCCQYWPLIHDSEVHYGDIRVQLMEEEVMDDWTIRTFYVKRGSARRIITQHHYTAWPDKGVPDNCTSVLKFHKVVFSDDGVDTNSSESPVVVHCSAGVGRTGTFIALDILLNTARHQQQIDIIQCVEKLRNQRLWMVQTKQQFVFVHHALLESLLLGEVYIPSANFHIDYYTLNQPTPPLDASKLSLQYKVLEALKIRRTSSICSTANSIDNRSKNRPTAVQPMDSSVVTLNSTKNNVSGYINAVHVYCSLASHHGCYDNKLTVTQMPMPHTSMDLWQLVDETLCSVIVMLNHPTIKDPQYWPIDGETIIDGQFQVFNVGEIHSDDIQLTNLIVKKLVETEADGDVAQRRIGDKRRSPVISPRRSGGSEKAAAPLQVRHLRVLNWPEGKALPAEKWTLLNLCEQVFKCHRKSPEGGIIVHCMGGAERSGLFCALLNVLYRVVQHTEVDVFNAVRRVRLSRPEFISSEEQFGVLYELTSMYLSSDFQSSFRR